MKRSTAGLLALAIVLLIAVNSSTFFFRQPFFETWDSAANSLDILHAKHFEALYGCYSRWGFHHPGPAFFYVQALGEWLFFDVLHLVPAPFNGQTLAHLALMAGFFAATLRVFANWLPEGERPWFLLGALGLGLLHFAAILLVPSYDVLRGPSTFTSTWSAHALVLPFICLLVTATSVAAGRGRDLPLLATAGGFLVHAHVAQPLFVVPFCVLAYAGLLWNARGRFLATWRSQLLAFGIVLFFASPVIVDLAQGPDNNLAAILKHRRAHQGEHKTLAQSLFYLLHFAGYAPDRPGQIEFKGDGRSGVLDYTRAHAAGVLASMFAVGLALRPLLGKAGGFRGGRRRADRSGQQEAGAVRVAATATAEGARERFLAWAGGFLALALGLTVFWGVIQVGPMYYYNSWFNFGIFYFAGLTAAAVVLARVQSRWQLPRWPAASGRTARPAWRWRVAAALAGGAAALAPIAFGLAKSWRVRDATPEATRTMHEGIVRALAESRAPGACKVLLFPTDAWPTVAGVALQLARAGEPFAVFGIWGVTFGTEHAWSALPPPGERTGGLQRWDFSLGGKYLRPTVGAPPAAIPLRDWVALSITPATLPLAGPGTEAEISFMPGGNAPAFILGGWSGPEAGGTWSEDYRAALVWRPGPVGDGEQVELKVEAPPLLVPKIGLTAQRMRVFFNGEPLGPERRIDEAAGPTSTFFIPAAQWNRAAASPAPQASLEFEFPDAVAPMKIDPTGKNGDPRLLAFGFRHLRFRVVPDTP